MRSLRRGHLIGAFQMAETQVDIAEAKWRWYWFLETKEVLDKAAARPQCPAGAAPAAPGPPYLLSASLCMQISPLPLQLGFPQVVGNMTTEHSFKF